MRRGRSPSSPSETSGSLPNFAGAFHFNQLSGTHVVDEPEYRDGLWHEGESVNRLDVVDDSLDLNADRRPSDVLAGGEAGPGAPRRQPARRQFRDVGHGPG